ncbi:MAG: ABC-2 transporter permease [Clostridiaceae bacterium]|nr:ABC-2 transporter permease [Clostridiaceae bacterium]
MKGLIIKDFSYLRATKVLMTIAVMTILFSLQGPMFVMCYMGIIGVSLTQTTFTYDEFEGGMSFLLTMPVTRRMYVKSKYAFAFLLGFCMMAGAAVLGAAVQLVKGGFDPSEWLVAVIVAVCMQTITLSLSIPTIIKLGIEKGRIMSFVFFAVIAAFIWGGVSILGRNAFADIGAFLAGIDIWTYVLIAVAAVSLLLFVSYRLSLRFMEKKEY